MPESPYHANYQALIDILHHAYPHLDIPTCHDIARDALSAAASTTNTLTMGVDNLLHDVTIQQGTIILQLPYPDDVAATARLSHMRFFDYSSWSTHHTAWMHEAFLTTNNARARFGQALALQDPYIHHVSRPAVTQQIEQWYQTWTSHQHPLVVLGNEGDGKTWAVASWIHEMMLTEQRAPVVFFASDHVMTTTIDTLMIEALQQSTTIDEHTARNILTTWAESPLPPASPWMIWVFDGMNQHHNSIFWQALLDHLRGDLWAKRIAVILTCRRAYWKDAFPHTPTHEVTVPPYTGVRVGVEQKTDVCAFIAL